MLSALQHYDHALVSLSLRFHTLDERLGRLDLLLPLDARSDALLQLRGQAFLHLFELDELLLVRVLRIAVFLKLLLLLDEHLGEQLRLDSGLIVLLLG